MTGGSVEENVRVILVGVGGATCSGKTTLAKHLRSTLPDSFIIHQDDFAPPQELIPYHPKYNVQDWDDPDGAIDWDRLAEFLGEKPVPVADRASEHWSARFQELSREAAARNTRLVFALLDGFLLYWDERVIRAIDVPLFLRVPHDVLVSRRKARSGYHTAVQSDPEGTFWQDPPGYWEQIVYPAYRRAHEGMFEGGDVERGRAAGRVKGLLLVEADKMDMSAIFDEACRAIELAVAADT